MAAANLIHRQWRWWAPAWVALGTAAAYGALLGWDQDGTYDDWQVAALVLIMGALAMWAGGRRAVWLSSFMATIVMTVLWSVDAATEPDVRNDGLWPVGAISVLLGTGLGFTAVAYFQRWRTGGSAAVDDGSAGPRRSMPGRTSRSGKEGR